MYIFFVAFLLPKTMLRSTLGVSDINRVSEINQYLIYRTFQYASVCFFPCLLLFNISRCINQKSLTLFLPERSKKFHPLSWELCDRHIIYLQGWKISYIICEKIEDINFKLTILCNFLMKHNCISKEELGFCSLIMMAVVI